ncbi:MAG: ShlB/FhaC/HecB family hemolysin secretion/activation protein [Pseudomonadota bacterium]
MKQRSSSATAKRAQLTTTASLAALGFSGVLLSGAAVAQERLPGVVDRPAVEAPGEVTQPQKLEPKKGPEMEKPEGAAEIVATLKSVKFSGTPILKEDVLQKVAAPYLNRPLTRADIARLKYDLTKRYYDEGYVLVKVTTPPQDLSAGVLEVTVYPGRIGELQIDNKGLSPRVAEAMSSRIVKGEVFNEKNVETAVKDLDDLTNIKSKLNLRPGKEFGTTDLLLTVEPAVEDVQAFMLDNYGSELTGKNVATLDLHKSNLFGMGETIGLNLRKSDDDLETALLDFVTPIGWRNVKLELNYLNSRNGIGDRLAALQATGKTERFGLAFSGRAINELERQVGWRVGLESRRHESFLAGTPESRDDISQAYAEGSYLKRAPNYVFYGNLRVTKGIDAFGANKEGDPLASRLNGDPEAWRALPTLYSNYRFTDNDYLQTIISGQVSSRTLLASDLFILGGYGSVRGFRPAQETGENGFQFSLEYNHQFAPVGGWVIKAGPFLDGGAVYNRIEPSAVDSHLYSLGLGAEAKSRPFKFGDTKLRLDWAHPVGSYNDPDVDNNTYYLRLTQNF